MSESVTKSASFVQELLAICEQIAADEAPGATIGDATLGAG